jgi:hypothetical protein
MLPATHLTVPTGKEAQLPYHTFPRDHKNFEFHRPAKVRRLVIFVPCFSFFCEKKTQIKARVYIYMFAHISIFKYCFLSFPFLQFFPLFICLLFLRVSSSSIHFSDPSFLFSCYTYFVRFSLFFSYIPYALLLFILSCFLPCSFLLAVSNDVCNVQLMQP